MSKDRRAARRTFDTFFGSGELRSIIFPVFMCFLPIRLNQTLAAFLRRVGTRGKHRIRDVGKRFEESALAGEHTKFSRTQKHDNG